MSDTAVDNDVTPEKKTVWFVREGCMHTSWIQGHMDINVEVHPSNTYGKVQDIAFEILSDEQDTRRMISRDTRLNEMIKRPGRWYYLSGCNTVHSDDLFATKEMAANKYMKFLME